MQSQNQSKYYTPKVGIDDLSIYVPKIYFDIKDLAVARDIEYAKLNKGLGLTQMAVPDLHEDAATMAANAVADLIDKNNLNPKTIGRLYLGTESGLDGSKPTATYILEMLRNKYKDQYGADCFLNCDVVDLTFACVGGVDALQNVLDWVHGDFDRVGIVVASDNAKYELGSSGEYTQGAGAAALLVKAEPRLLAFNNTWGVATMGVHDFFKPKRRATKEQIVKEVLQLASIHANGNVKTMLEKLPESLEVNGVLDANDIVLTLHKDTPVFDGQYSNQCYQDRIGEAYQHLLDQKANKNTFDKNSETKLFDTWKHLVFHLPYAFHAKRIFSDIFVKELKRTGKWDAFEAQLEIKEPTASDFENDSDFQKMRGKFLRGVTKTAEYRALVNDKIEKGQRASSYVGNMYTCSIFLALASILEAEHQEGTDLNGETLGFLGYGSGSKSKVFEATVQPQWKEITARIGLSDTLQKRQAIDYDIYYNLHTGKLPQSTQAPQDEFALVEIGDTGVTEGARYYEWK